MTQHRVAVPAAIVSFGTRGYGLRLPSWVTLAVSVNLARRKAVEPAGRCLLHVIVGLSLSDLSYLFVSGIMVGLC